LYGIGRGTYHYGMANEPRIIGQSAPSTASAPAVPASPAAVPEPSVREIGGRNGPEPTRYGDWEKNGRCIDF
jgi:hypothetical protein